VAGKCRARRTIRYAAQLKVARAAVQEHIASLVPVTNQVSHNG
jgi:hypothetical protein